MQTKLVLKQPSAIKLRFQPGATGPQGPQGIQGIQGVQGDNGWTPELATVTDGIREVQQVVDWFGGEGTKPTTGLYVGDTGLVADIANGKDIRGPQGPSGSVTDGDKGDITVSSSGTVWTIDNNAVSTAKIPDDAVTTAKIADAELKALAGLTSAADKLPYFTGSGTASTTDLSSFARTLLDNTTAQAARNTLGVRNQAFSVNKGGTNQGSIASGVITKITFAIEAYDQGGYYDQSNHRWTPPAGNIQLRAIVMYAAGIVDQTTPRVYIYKNGSALAYSIQNTSGTGGISASIYVEDVANGTDYYEVFFFNASGIDMTISGADQLTSFCGRVL